MARKKTKRRLRITEDDYLKANRRAARLEEIALHGKPVKLRCAPLGPGNCMGAE